MYRRFITLIVLSAVLLCACAGSDASGSPQQQLRTWVTGTGLKASTISIFTDLQHVNQAIASKQTNAVQTTCSVMANDADAANSNLPSPNENVSNLLSNGYSQVGLAANDCFVALSSPSQLRSYQSHERQARSLFSEAGAIIESQTGLVVTPKAIAP